MYQDLSRVTLSKIHDKNVVVKGAKKILGFANLLVLRFQIGFKGACLPRRLFGLL